MIQYHWHSFYLPAVRFGRMPKVEREKLLADREELTSTSSRRIVELRTLTDLIKAAFRDTFSNTVFFSHQHGHCHDVQHLQHLRVPESSTPCHPFTSSQSPSAPSSPSTTPAENFVSVRIILDLALITSENNFLVFMLFFDLSTSPSSKFEAELGPSNHF